MFTIFHLFEILGFIFGLFFGGKLGYENFGWLGLILGTVGGSLCGLILGKIPFLIGFAYLKYELRKSSNEKLKEDLETKPYIAHLILAELKRRD